MMEVDDIFVSIAGIDGSKYPTYANPYEKRHPDFYGSLGSRQVVVAPGSPVEVIVEFTPNFKLYSATGVGIIIAIGDKTAYYVRDDNCQVSWLNASQMNIRQRHRFTPFVVGEDHKASKPTRHVPLQMPRPNREFHIGVLLVPC